MSGITHYIQANRLAHDLQYGTREQKIAAAKQLIRKDRLYDKVEQMPVKDRIKAMESVEAVPGKLSIERCVILLKDPEKTVHKRVVKALIILGNDHVDFLVEKLKDSDENVRTGAADALVGIGTKVIPLVKEAMNDADLRKAACDVLVRLKEPSVPALAELLQTGDQDVRMVAAEALGKIGSKKATPSLLKAMGDIQAVRRIAISSLCAICDPRCADPLIQVLGGNRDDGEVRARAARALSVIGGPKAIAALTGALGDWDLKVGTSAISGIQRIGAPAVQEVMATISSGSPEIRRAGASVLERVDASEAAAALVKLAKDSDPAIRASAARGLGIQSTGARTDLLVSLMDDPNASVADAAENSLAGMKKKVVPELVSALRSSSSDIVRYRAANALAEVGSPAVPSLLSALNSGGETAKWAAYALGRAGDPRGKAALERFALASDPDMAWVAERAMDRL
jgi:HEAT repeat protein